MSDSFLPYKNPDTTDMKLDSEQLTVGSETVERERIQVTGKAAAEIQDVKNAKPAPDAYGSIVRPVPAGVILATVSAGVTGTGVVGSAQEVGARFFCLQLAGTWVGGITVEESNDNTNWVAIGMFDTRNLLQASGGGVFSQLTSNNIVYGYVRGRYVRVFCAAYTSGTIDVTCLLYGDTPPPTGMRVHLPVSASNPTKTEDAAHASGDVGMNSLGVANEAGSQLSDTDGDYTPIALTRKGRGQQTQRPEILATISGSPTATGVVGTSQDVGAKSLALQLTGTWVGTVTIEQSNDGSNWIGTILYDVAGSVMGGSGGVFTGITLNGLFIANIHARYVRVNVTSYTSGTIGVTAILWGEAVAPSTIKIIPHSSTTTGLVKQEDLAHGSGDVGVFMLVVRNDANAVRASTDGDYQALSVDKLGRPIVTTAPRGQRAKNAITLTSTTETTLLSAGGASVFHDLTKLVIANTSSTDVRVDFRDATGGSVIFSVYAPANQTVGVVCGDDPIPQTTANNNWTAQLSAAVTDVRIFVQAIKEA